MTSMDVQCTCFDAALTYEVIELDGDVDEACHTQRQAECDVDGLDTKPTVGSVVQPRHQGPCRRQHYPNVVETANHRRNKRFRHVFFYSGHVF